MTTRIGRFSAWMTFASIVTFATTAHASEAITATATCNQQWVNITVTHVPGYVMARKPGKDWFLAFDRFVPDIGATNPAGDYDINVDLELWDRPYEQHTVMAATTVRTPNCAAPTTSTTTTTVAPPAPPRFVVAGRPIEPQLSWLSVLPDWLLRAVVEAVRGIV